MAEPSGSRCQFCNTPLPIAVRDEDRICTSCWDKGRRPFFALSPDPESEPPGGSPGRLRWRKVPKDERISDEDHADEFEAGPDREDFRGSTPGRVRAILGLVFLVLPSLILIALAMLERRAAFGLIVWGGFVALAGVAWLFHEASQDGFTLTAYSSGNPMLMLVLAGVRLAATPIFAIVFLIMNFSSGWKPVLLLGSGIGLAFLGYLMLG